MWDLDSGQVIYAPDNETTTATVITLVASSSAIGLSAIALVLLFLTALLFPEWRLSYKNQVLIQFITCRFVYVLLRYFKNVRNVFGLNEMDSENYFYVKMYILVYTEISFVIWMLIFSNEIYKSMVKVFHTHEGSIWMNIVMAWGVPIVLASIFNLGIFYFEDSYLKVHLVYFFSIKWPILMANAILLCISLRTVLKTNVKVQNNRRITIVMVLLIYMFSIQFMFMDIYNIIHMVLLQKQMSAPYAIQALYVAYNIFAIYQFAFSAMFWLFGNAKTRQHWKFAPKNQRVISQISARINIITTTKL